MSTASPPPVPHVIEITGGVDCTTAFRRLSSHEHCLFLDSAQRSNKLGRYSFVAAAPFDVIRLQDSDPTALSVVSTTIQRYVTDPVAELPPFQGGVAGLWSYELLRCFEQVPRSQFDEFRLPVLDVGLYDVVVGFDHQSGRAWIISQGFPETDCRGRRDRARARAEQFRDWLQKEPVARSPVALPRKLRTCELAPNFETPHVDVLSNFQPDGYQRAVQRVIDYIRAGDVFQVNLSQRLLHPAIADPVDFYLGLRAANPAPFGAYYDLGAQQICSTSPERFLRVRDRRVETRPIKGTRPRFDRPEAQLFSGAELRGSGKDLAENVMIVDLMRNDLSRTCDDHSVRVSQLCAVETYQYVQHLVSVVQGRLRDDASLIDLIAMSFPGGSITGAPKVRAMEIIAELEPTARGAYCGCLGYLGFDGSLDLNILIRTVTVSGGWWQFPVGGGIVAQSLPRREHEETWHKAAGILQAIQATKRP